VAEPTFHLVEPPHGAPATPLVVSVPHAGIVVPDEDRGALALHDGALLKDADLFVDRLVKNAPRLGAPLLVADVSRYVLDVNRGPDDVDAEVCPELAHPAKSSSRGLIWRLTTDGAAILQRPLSKREVDSRTSRIHVPYHHTLAALLEDRRQRFGFAILLDAHSMPSLGRTGHADPGMRRADVVPGDVRGQSCDARLTRAVIDHFERAAFAVRPNDPYMGGFVTRHHGRPQKGVHAIQLELNRDLYMDETSCTYLDKRADKLLPVIDGLLAHLV
jgi:N-formylglutamate deformylase